MADSMYCFSMFVSLGNRQNLAIDRIGGFFSVDSVYEESWPGWFDLPMHVTSPAGVFLTDTAEWILIEGTYEAVVERFLLIGNSFDETQTNYLEVDGWGSGWDVAYYFIDDVSLLPCNTLSTGEFSGLAIEAEYKWGDLILKSPSGTNWSLYRSSGKHLDGYQSVGEHSIIDIGTLSGGLYILQWTYTGQTGVEKIMINR